MIDEIKKNLNVLIGLPLWSIGRAGSVYWFVFGNQRRLIKMDNGKEKTVSDYSLHVQCAWRISIKDKITISSRDKNYPPGDDPYKDIEDFDYDDPNGNRLDERIISFFNNLAKQPLTVTCVEASNKGDLKIVFVNDIELEIFIDDTVIEEYWRLFIPYNEKAHFVITSSCI